MDMILFPRILLTPPPPPHAISYVLKLCFKFVSGNDYQTHLVLAKHISVSERGHYWFRHWLVACSSSNHYKDLWWGILHWNYGNMIRWKFNQIQNVFEWKIEIIAAKLWPFCPGLTNWPHQSAGTDCECILIWKKKSLLFFNNIICQFRQIDKNALSLYVVLNLCSNVH